MFSGLSSNRVISEGVVSEAKNWEWLGVISESVVSEAKKNGNGLYSALEKEPALKDRHITSKPVSESHTTM